MTSSVQDYIKQEDTNVGGVLNRSRIQKVRMIVCDMSDYWISILTNKYIVRTRMSVIKYEMMSKVLLQHTLDFHTFTDIFMVIDILSEV